jgi:hypothetical protein
LVNFALDTFATHPNGKRRLQLVAKRRRFYRRPALSARRENGLQLRDGRLCHRRRREREEGEPDDAKPHRTSPSLTFAVAIFFILADSRPNDFATRRRFSSP